MAGVSNFAALKLLDTLHRVGAAYQPAGLYLALFTTNPDFDTGAGGTEATGGSYARVAITFDAAANGSSASSNLIEFTVGTNVAAGTYTGAAIYDASTNGNLLSGKAFAQNRVLSVTGDKISFAIGSVVDTLA